MILLSILVFVGYLTFYISICGMLRSISDSWYELKKRPIYTKKGKIIKLEGLFTLATWGYTLPLLICVSIKSQSVWDILLFLAASMICFVGSAPDFKKADRGWHSFFAEGGIVLLLLWLFVSGGWIIGLCTVALMIPFLVFDVKNNTFWLEVIAYGSMIMAAV